MLSFKVLSTVLTKNDRLIGHCDSGLENGLGILLSGLVVLAYIMSLSLSRNKQWPLSASS
jgi:hypothetical protein